MAEGKDLLQVLWSGADVLRGKMDANEYKTYLLGLVFYKYLSDSYLSKAYDLLKDEHLNGATKLSLINRWDEVLSLDLTKEKTHGLEEEYIKEMIEKRAEAKKNKDFALADSIREELLKQGIILKDTREGTIYEVK